MAKQQEESKKQEQTPKTPKLKKEEYKVKSPCTVGSGNNKKIYKKGDTIRLTDKGRKHFKNLNII